MPGPTPSWNTVPLFGTWRNFDGTLKAGTFKVSLGVRVTNKTDDAIVPAGVVAQGALNEKEATGGAATHSLYIDVPASDDSDNEVQGWQLVVEVSFKDAPAEKYTVDPLLSTLPVGINLRKVLLPQSLPVPATVLIRGVPGGLAEYDKDGDVVNAAGTKILGGSGGTSGPVSSSSITDATTVGKAVLTATNSAAALSAIGAKASTYVPAWGEVTGKPTLFPPSTHGHFSTDIADLVEAVQDIVAATLTAGSNVTIAYDDTAGKVTVSASGSGSGGAPYRVDYAKKFNGVWPPRPTDDPTVLVFWVGPDPSPAIVTSGTGGMLDGQDVRMVTP